MLRLLIGKDWTAIRNEIMAEMAADVAAQKPGRILIVPELISHDTERRLCAAAGDTASRFAEVLSFPRLARRVAEYARIAPVECLDNGGRLVAMAAAARQLHSQLKAYASVETKPEFLTELVDAVDEFKRCCVTSEDLQFAARQTEGALAQKLEELSLLLSAYDSLCQRGKHDPREQMSLLPGQLADCDFAQNHVFYIDGFPDFTRQHMAVLEQLIRTSPSVTVGINCDWVDSDALAFEKAGFTAAQILKCAKNAGVEYKVVSVKERSGPLQEACEALFQGNIPTNVPNLTTQRCENLFAEVHHCAEKIMALVRNGYRYRQIGIVCTDMNAYGDYIRMYFRRCGIPVYQSGNEDILQQTVIATVLAAMEAALGGFEQRDVLRYLRSILSRLDPDICDLMENYAVVWGVRGKRWQETWTQHPDGLGQIWTEDAKVRLNKLNEAREFALSPLFRLRDGFLNSKKLSEQVGALYAFLEDIQLSRQLENLAKEMDAEGDNRSAQILNQLWEILLTALEQMDSVLGDTVWEAEVFVRLLKLQLSQYDVGTIPPVLDAVTAGPVNAMRCQQVKHLFVLGASEGALPGYAGSQGLLSDQERVALRQLGVPLTGGAMEGIQAEFAEIYGVFCGAEESIHVSCCGAQPSYVLRRLEEMAENHGTSNICLGPAAFDAQEAGAYLAAWQARETACGLGVENWYDETCAKSDHNLGSVTQEHIQELYGNKLNLSASQVDRQAECRLSYFLRYGIAARERKEAKVDPAEFGTYVHAVLEHTAGRVMELGGFHQVSLEETMQIALAYSEEYIAERFSQIDSNRLNYLFRRNSRELSMVVEELWQELKDSAFAPSDFELAFGDQGKMPAIEVPAKKMLAALRGFVDRVDIWKTDSGSFFRVVDYKTGRKDFDYCDVYNGVGLQMLLYLFALEENGEDIVGKGATPAGIQYFPARAPILSSDSYLNEDEARAARLKEWKRRGLLLNDDRVLEAMEPGGEMKRLSCSRKKDGSLSGDLAGRGQLTQLKDYVFGLLADMVDEIASGNVTPNPYTRGSSHNACTYCPYGSICHPETVAGRRNYKTMEPEKFWDSVQKEVQRRG